MGFLRRLSPYMIKKGILYLRHYGLKEFWIRLQERMEPEEVPYGPWYEAYRPDEKELARQRAKRFARPLLFSLCVPVYHPPGEFLEAMIESVLAQTYPGFELCLVQADPLDHRTREILSSYEKRDARIRVKTLEKNLGIAGNTNEAIAMATGDWVGLLDHDDLLAPEALYTLMEALEKRPLAKILYTDEDKVREGEEHFQPHLKPDFSLDLLRSNNYICHLFLARRDLLSKVGPMSSDYEGAQDYDFILRCVEEALDGDMKKAARARVEEICHVPEILYHWRVHAASTADNPASKAYAYESGRRAIEDHLRRMGVAGEVAQTSDHGFYEVSYPVQGEPLVSLIVPNRDKAGLLKEFLTSLSEKTTYPAYEVLIVENGSVEEETFALYKDLEERGLPGGQKVSILRYEGGFHYSAINNLAAAKARGDYLVLCNNDIVIRTGDWLERFLGICQRPEVGAVGAKLLYPDGTIQHAGVVVGLGGIAGAMFVGMDGRRSGYLHKASLLQDVSAVTAACMMVDKKAYEKVGGLCQDLAVAFNDVDFCLKLRREGLLVVYCPSVTHIHGESKTRGPEDTPEKVRRFQSEIEYMRSHWIQILKEGDPFYNKNLSLTKWNYSLRPLEKK